MMLKIPLPPFYTLRVQEPLRGKVENALNCNRRRFPTLAKGARGDLYTLKYEINCNVTRMESKIK